MIFQASKDTLVRIITIGTSILLLSAIVILYATSGFDMWYALLLLKKQALSPKTIWAWQYAYLHPVACGAIMVFFIALRWAKCGGMLHNVKIMC